MVGKGIEKRTVQGRIRVRRLVGQASRSVARSRKTIEKNHLSRPKSRESRPQWMLERQVTLGDERAISVSGSPLNATPRVRNIAVRLRKLTVLLFSARALASLAFRQIFIDS